MAEAEAAVATQVEPAARVARRSLVVAAAEAAGPTERPRKLVAEAAMAGTA